MKIYLDAAGIPVPPTSKNVPVTVLTGSGVRPLTHAEWEAWAIKHDIPLNPVESQWDVILQEPPVDGESTPPIPLREYLKDLAKDDEAEIIDNIAEIKPGYAPSVLHGYDAPPDISELEMVCMISEPLPDTPQNVLDELGIVETAPAPDQDTDFEPMRIHGGNPTRQLPRRRRGSNHPRPATDTWEMI